MKAAEHLIQSALDGNQDSGIMISRLSSDIKSLDDKEMIESFGQLGPYTFCS